MLEPIDLGEGKRYFPNDFCYDLESYPNVWTMTIVRCDGKHLRQYEISHRKNDLDGLIKCLRYLIENKCRMIAYNNLGYDYHLIHEIIEILILAKKSGKSPAVKAEILYHLTMQIIEAMKDEDRSFKSIPESQHFIKQVDLYKLNHFDNKAKRTSLKVLEVNMRSKNVEDLPFPVGKVLTDDEIDVLLKYNTHDVMETLKFYYYNIDALVLREVLSERFGFDCTNYSDTKIGETLFIESLESTRPGSCYVQSKFGRKPRQTKRDKIDIGECLFDYLKFDRPEFKAIYDWLSNQVVTETKGVFSDYEEHLIGEVAKYAEMKTKKSLFKNTLALDSKGKPKSTFELTNTSHMEELNRLKVEFLEEHPMGWFEETNTSKSVKVNAFYRVVEAMNVIVEGCQYVFGTGGIHMSVEGQTITEDNEYCIIDADCTSMYPSISMVNRIYPEHLGENFCDVYMQLFQERKKHPKGSGQNLAIKLALNSVYGLSNSEYSPMYDPKYTLTITVNGQLSLTMLTERLIELGCKMIQANTDGVTALVPRKKVDEYYELCKQWEKETKLTLEYAEYKMMAIANVNNYVAVYTNGDVKTKGRYEVADFDKLGWHKDHSAMIVPKAAVDYIVHGVPIRQTIYEHKNPFDFCLRVKVPRNSKLMLIKQDTETQQQNICRYFPSVDGGKLMKLMPPLKEGADWRRLGIDTEYEVSVCNDMDDFDWNKLNYEYFIKEAEKLVDGVTGSPF